MSEPITGYLDQRSRMDYLRQKVAAEGRMEKFDRLPGEVREVYNAAGTMDRTTWVWRQGCRTFEDVERVMAGVWRG